MHDPAGIGLRHPRFGDDDPQDIGHRILAAHSDQVFGQRHGQHRFACGHHLGPVVVAGEAAQRLEPACFQQLHGRLKLACHQPIVIAQHHDPASLDLAQGEFVIVRHRQSLAGVDVPDAGIGKAFHHIAGCRRGSVVRDQYLEPVARLSHHRFKAVPQCIRALTGWDHNGNRFRHGDICNPISGLSPMIPCGVADARLAAVLCERASKSTLQQICSRVAGTH